MKRSETLLKYNPNWRKEVCQIQLSQISFLSNIYEFETNNLLVKKPSEP